MRINYKEKKLVSEDKVLDQYAIESTKLELQSNLLATRHSLEKAKKELEDMKTEYPLDFTSLVDKMDEVDSLERGLKSLNSLAKELGLN